MSALRDQLRRQVARFRRHVPPGVIGRGAVIGHERGGRLVVIDGGRVFRLGIAGVVATRCVDGELEETVYVEGSEVRRRVLDPEGIAFQEAKDGQRWPRYGNRRTRRQATGSSLSQALSHEQDT